MEASAKLDDNVIEIFATVAKQVASKQRAVIPNQPNDVFSPTQLKSKKNNS